MNPGVKKQFLTELMVEIGFVHQKLMLCFQLGCSTSFLLVPQSQILNFKTTKFLWELISIISKFAIYFFGQVAVGDGVGVENANCCARLKSGSLTLSQLTAHHAQEEICSGHSEPR